MQGRATWARLGMPTYIAVGATAPQLQDHHANHAHRRRPQVTLLPPAQPRDTRAMLGPRCLAAPARQCLRQVHAQVPLAARCQRRTYATPESKKIAKFPGTKGSDGKYMAIGVSPGFESDVQDVPEGVIKIFIRTLSDTEAQGRKK